VLRLIVIVKLPGQIRNQEQDDGELTNDPEGSFVLEKMFYPARAHSRALYRPNGEQRKVDRAVPCAPTDGIIPWRARC
jgi:hypothetical protein